MSEIKNLNGQPNRATRGLPAVLAMMLVTLPTTACIGTSNRAIAPNTSPANASDSAVNSANRAAQTVRSLVNLGPRVTGTPAAERASRYLIDEYRKAGYQTRVQTFQYEKFVDLGSNVAVNGAILNGRALNGSIAGNPTARLVSVANAGRTSDFAATDVRGAIAIVRRGGIPFAQKADNAANAGAIGLIVVNNEDGDVRGTLGRPAKIPVITLSERIGNRLIEQAATAPQITLNVNTQEQTVTGRNVIAYQEGTTQPKLLLGGHYDSVAGSPGANDNASGTAVVLTIAQQLANTSLASQIWFVAFDGEEDGLQGSRAFVRDAQPQFLASLKGMMNFDMVGVNDRLFIGGSPALTPLAKNTNPIASSSIEGRSDHAAFAAKDVPILVFYRGQDPNYHTPNDKTVDVNLLDRTTQTAIDIVTQLLQAS